MTDVWPQLEPLLANVAKPARYIGLEDGARTPHHAPEKVAWLLSYPDTYEIGLPNQGLQILYEILNENPNAVAERAYAPWTDLESLLRDRNIPLFSIDSHRPAGLFDLIGFNLSAELTYTNLLNMVDLAVRIKALGPNSTVDTGFAFIVAGTPLPAEKDADGCQRNAGGEGFVSALLSASWRREETGNKGVRYMDLR